MIEAVSQLSVQSVSQRYAPQAGALYSGSSSAADNRDFISSRVRMDNMLNRAILEYRSAEGEVVRQYPTQSQIQAFKQAQAAAESHYEAARAAAGAQASVHMALQETGSGHTSSAPAVSAPTAPAGGGEGHVSSAPQSGGGSLPGGQSILV